MTERYKNSEEFLGLALQVIPLGSQTFSKSKTALPFGVSPYFVERAKGSRMWDMDGNEYLDFVSALCCVTLGYGDSDVDAAVRAQMDNGVTFSLPHRLETEVAELLVEMIPCAEKVRFAKNGTDATSGAIRVARAHTGRNRVAVCGYHGWQDWYIGTTLRDLGVPQAVKELTHTFSFNDIGSLRRLLNTHPGEFAAVILEPMNATYPKDGFLEKVLSATHQHGALLIFDETITGFRYATGGAQEEFGVTPDLATFGKGIANGYPLSALVGKSEYMKVVEDIFFSGTFGGETLSLAAAKAVLTKLKHEPVIQTMRSRGQSIIDGVHQLIAALGLEQIVSIGGHPSWSFLTFRENASFSPAEIKTLFIQEVFKRGVYVLGTHNLSYAHSEADVKQLLECYREVFGVIARGLSDGTLRNLLECEPLVPLFKVR
jgi:glutamate-1-semialdehyde aminotransferase